MGNKCIINNLKIPHGEVTEFCIECGASFPPRFGEGICKEWKECETAQRDYFEKAKKQVRDFSSPSTEEGKGIVQV